ncbi:MAG TPA: hypothetical protein PKH43_03235 [Saprospiraceae bacterium]|nr:hypothetical protein [Saprospiraceae bacterium]
MDAVRQYIAGEERLDELVNVYDLLEHKPGFSAMHLIVRQRQGIVLPIDWQNALPPFLLPEEIPFERDTLLGIIFSRLGNDEKARHYLAAKYPALLYELNIISRLCNGRTVSPSELHSDFRPFEEYRFCHNSAILYHYAANDSDFDPNKTRYFYEEAIQAAPNDEYGAFSTKNFATFLTDFGELDEAERLLQLSLPTVLSDEGAHELKAALCQVWLKKLTVPYDRNLLERLKATLWEVLQHYSRQQRKPEEALTLVDAAQIAHYSDSFAEALGYINRAIEIFRQEEMPELLAQAHHRRAMLLYSWAKTGQPQFFKGALDSFKEAAKVFTREEAPDVFADIQQYLGIIYAEMPDETLKQSMWAAISSSAFQDALSFYNKKDFPFDYARVCNHYGNALTKSPPAVHSDNIEKALFYYNEALDVRRADLLPVERAVTLLNYVEACWHLNLEGRSSNRPLYNDMLAKAEEARTLTDDPNIREEATAQLRRLSELGATLAREEAESIS